MRKSKYVKVTLEFILTYDEEIESVPYGLGQGTTMLEFIQAGLEKVKLKPHPQEIGPQSVKLFLHPEPTLRRFRG